METSIKKKKILFIIYTYSMGGGAEFLLTNIVNNLNPNKYDISIIEYAHYDIKDEPINSNIHLLPSINEKNQYYNLIYNNEEFINKYIPSGFDLYISFNYQIPTFLLPYGTTNISWIHTDVYDLNEPDKFLEKLLQDIAFAKTQKIVAISNNTDKSLRELFPNHEKKIVKIYNGIDINLVRKKALETSPIQLKRKSIIFVGRLEDRKNPIRIIEVLKLLHKKGCLIHAYFLGKGNLEKQIKDLATEYYLDSFVHLLGYCQNPYPIIKQASVCCLLSHAEGFSMTLLESISLDVPFVSTNIGGSDSLCDGGKCGTIINTDEEAANAIIFWLNKNKQIIECACRKSIERFSLQKYISNIENCFDKLLKKPFIPNEREYYFFRFLRKLALYPMFLFQQDRGNDLWKSKEAGFNLLKRVFYDRYPNINGYDYLFDIYHDIIIQLIEYQKKWAQKNKHLIEKIGYFETIIIFGAGSYGKKCFLNFFQGIEEKLMCFADNSEKMMNKTIFNKTILSPAVAIKRYPGSLIIVCNKNNSTEMINQLSLLKIRDNNIIIFEG